MQSITDRHLPARQAKKCQVVLTGWGFYSAYAENVPQLIEGLQQGLGVSSRSYFADEVETKAKAPQLKVNPHYVPFPPVKGFQRVLKTQKTLGLNLVSHLLERVITEALNRAQLLESALSGKRVRVYLAGHGMRGDLADFGGYKDRNDGQDLAFFPRIKALSSISYAQDTLAQRLTRRYHLDCEPISLYSASSSGLSAVHLAQEVIGQGDVDVALVIGWNNVTLQDVLFLGGQNLLTAGSAQPFNGDNNGNNNSGMLLSSGVVALVLENQHYAKNRLFPASVVLNSSVSYQSSGALGGHSFNADFRAIAATIESLLLSAEMTAEQVEVIFPHGNGIYSSDKAESMAINKIWGQQGIKVVSYKGQIGYLSTCSALVDLIIISDALQQQRLFSSRTKESSGDGLGLRLQVNMSDAPLQQKAIVKVALGLEGSIVSCLVSRVAGVSGVDHDAG